MQENSDNSKRSPQFRKIRKIVLLALAIVVTVVTVFFGVLAADTMIREAENRSGVKYINPPTADRCAHVPPDFQPPCIR